MRFQVILPKNVQKDLLKLDKHIQNKVSRSLNILSNSPYIGKKLAGKHEGEFSIRIWPYRIIYEINKNKGHIIIHRIAHRQGVYK